MHFCCWMLINDNQIWPTISVVKDNLWIIKVLDDVFVAPIIFPINTYTLSLFVEFFEINVENISKTEFHILSQSVK